MFIWAHTGKNNVILLSTLKSIHAGHLDFLQSPTKENYNTELELSVNIHHLCYSGSCWKRGMYEGITKSSYYYQVEIGVKRSAKLHVLYNIGSLSFVRSDHSYLLRLDSCTKKSSGNLLHIGSFSPVRRNKQWVMLPNHKVQFYVWLTTRKLESIDEKIK